jgi:hypothetical protein
MSRTDLTYFADVLRANGYVVIPRARHVVLQASFIANDRDYAKYPERVLDAAEAECQRRIMRQAADQGLFVTVVREVVDGITGNETVINVGAGFIKPKADDEV